MVAVIAPNGTEATTPAPAASQVLHSLSELQQRNRHIVSKFAVFDMFLRRQVGGAIARYRPLEALLRSSSYRMISREYDINMAAIWPPVHVQSALMRAIPLPSSGIPLDQATFCNHRECIDTPDGDWFHAGTKYANRMSPTFSDFQPPLASSANSPVSKTCTRPLFSRAWTVPVSTFAVARDRPTTSLLGTGQQPVGGLPIGLYSRHLALFAATIDTYTGSNPQRGHLGTTGH
jgi:hypothetical protein